MKSNIFKILTVAVLILTTLTACDDYLTKENPNETTTDTYWQTLDQTQSGLYATYATLRNDYLLCIREEAWRSDMAWPGYGRPAPTTNDAGWQYYCQMYNNTTSSISNKWEALYIGVWRANQVIEALENNFDLATLSDSDLETWEYQMGQAHFMRGLFYFYLSSSFNEGSVVLRTKVPTTSEEYNQALSPAEDVLAFYRDELEKAYELLPYESPAGDAFVGLPTKGAALTILGTSYLYKKEYEEAEACFAEIITDGNYSYKLEQDLSKMFTTAGEFNSESIFEVVFSLDQRTDIGTWNTNCMYNRLGTMTINSVGCLLAAWVAWAYAHEPMDPTVAANYIDGDITKDLRTVSLRASAQCAVIIDVETPYHITTNAAEQSGIFGGPLGEWGFGRYKKYTNHDLSEEKTLMSGKNVVVNRLSDVYLMYAECLIYRGEIQEALDYINQIRYRWGLVLLGEPSQYPTRTYDNVIYTAETLLAHLQFTERPLELSLEGHQIRWQDLLRWGMLEDDSNNVFKRMIGNPDYLFWSDNFTPVGLDGTQLDTSNNSTLVKEQPTAEDSVSQYIDYEYEQAAGNYLKSANAYYPIPNTEIMTNSSISAN